MRNTTCALATIVLVMSMSAAARAQVPADIAQGLKKIGAIVDPSCTAKLYRPLMPKNDITSSTTPLYPGIAVARDVAFGKAPKDVVDIFSAEKGPNSRQVLIYIPGGAGNKIEIQNREANAFYDNIGRWATKNGMVGVTMQRHAGESWDDGGRDVSTMIQWLQANIAKYRGNPDRMFIWAHSAGNVPLGTYVGRPELHGAKGVGVKGVIFMSGQFNVAPLEAGPFPGGGGRGGPGAGGFNPLAGSGSSWDQAQPSRKRVRFRGAVLDNPEDQHQERPVVEDRACRLAAQSIPTRC
jgi:Carboxylesterase family